MGQPTTLEELLEKARVKGHRMLESESAERPHYCRGCMAEVITKEGEVMTYHERLVDLCPNQF
jgi:hypothetical protein